MNKRGSAYVEASMVMPMACLILFALAGLIMTFHGQVARQAAAHREAVAEWNCEADIEKIRRYERFIDWI